MGSERAKCCGKERHLPSVVSPAIANTGGPPNTVSFVNAAAGMNEEAPSKDARATGGPGILPGAFRDKIMC